MDRITDDIDLLNSPERGEAPSLILSETGDDTDLDVSFTKGTGEDGSITTEADSPTDPHKGPETLNGTVSEYSDDSKIEATVFDKDECTERQNEQFVDEPDHYFAEETQTKLHCDSNSTSSASAEETIDDLLDELEKEQKHRRDTGNLEIIVKGLDKGNLDTIVEVGSVLERSSSQAMQSEGKCEESGNRAPMEDILVMPAETDVSSELEEEHETNIESSKFPSNEDSDQSDDGSMKGRVNVIVDTTDINTVPASNVDDYVIAVTLTQDEIENTPSKEYESEQMTLSSAERRIEENSDHMNLENLSTNDEEESMSDHVNDYEYAIKVVQKDIDQTKMKQKENSQQIDDNNNITLDNETKDISNNDFGNNKKDQREENKSNDDIQNIGENIISTASKQGEPNEVRDEEEEEAIQPPEENQNASLQGGPEVSGDGEEVIQPAEDNENDSLQGEPDEIKGEEEAIQLEAEVDTKETDNSSPLVVVDEDREENDVEFESKHSLRGKPDDVRGIEEVTHTAEENEIESLQGEPDKVRGIEEEVIQPAEEGSTHSLEGEPDEVMDEKVINTVGENENFSQQGATDEIIGEEEEVIHPAEENENASLHGATDEMSGENEIIQPTEEIETGSLQGEPDEVKGDEKEIHVAEEVDTKETANILPLVAADEAREENDIEGESKNALQGEPDESSGEEEVIQPAENSDNASLREEPDEISDVEEVSQAAKENESTSLEGEPDEVNDLEEGVVRAAEESDNASLRGEPDEVNAEQEEDEDIQSAEEDDNASLEGEPDLVSVEENVLQAAEESDYTSLEGEPDEICGEEEGVIPLAEEVENASIDGEPDEISGFEKVSLAANEDENDSLQGETDEVSGEEEVIQFAEENENVSKEGEPDEISDKKEEEIIQHAEENENASIEGETDEVTSGIEEVSQPAEENDNVSLPVEPDEVSGEEEEEVLHLAEESDDAALQGEPDEVIYIEEVLQPTEQNDNVSLSVETDEVSGEEEEVLQPAEESENASKEGEPGEVSDEEEVLQHGNASLEGEFNLISGEEHEVILPAEKDENASKEGETNEISGIEEIIKPAEQNEIESLQGLPNQIISEEEEEVIQHAEENEISSLDGESNQVKVIDNEEEEVIQAAEENENPSLQGDPDELRGIEERIYVEAEDDTKETADDSPQDDPDELRGGNQLENSRGKGILTEADVPIMFVQGDKHDVKEGKALNETIGVFHPCIEEAGGSVTSVLEYAALGADEEKEEDFTDAQLEEFKKRKNDDGHVENEIVKGEVIEKRNFLTGCGEGDDINVSAEIIDDATYEHKEEHDTFPPSYYIEREWSENSSSIMSMADDNVLSKEDPISLVEERKGEHFVLSPPSARRGIFDGVFKVSRNNRSLSVPKVRNVGTSTNRIDRPDSEPVGRSRRVCSKVINNGKERNASMKKRENSKASSAMPRYLQLYQMSKSQTRPNIHKSKVTTHPRSKGRRSSILPSSDDIFTRLYNLSKPMQEVGKEKRTQLATKGKGAWAIEKPKTRTFSTEDDPGLRLYEQGMQSIRNLEERRAKRHGAGYRSPLRDGIRGWKKEKPFHLF